MRRKEAAKNWKAFQDALGNLGDLNDSPREQELLLRAGYSFLESLPIGSPVDRADHDYAMRTREDCMQQCERFCVGRDISL